MFCKKCGAEINEGEKFCPACGTPIETEAAPIVATPASAPAPKGNDLLPMILGIISFVVCETALAGIILGAIARKKAKAFAAANGGQHSKKSKLGKTFGTLGLVFGIIFIAVWVIVAIIYAVIAAAAVAAGVGDILVDFIRAMPFGF